MEHERRKTNPKNNGAPRRGTASSTSSSNYDGVAWPRRSWNGERRVERSDADRFPVVFAVVVVVVVVSWSKRVDRRRRRIAAIDWPQRLSCAVSGWSTVPFPFASFFVFAFVSCIENGPPSRERIAPFLLFGFPFFSFDSVSFFSWTTSSTRSVAAVSHCITRAGPHNRLDQTTATATATATTTTTTTTTATTTAAASFSAEQSGNAVVPPRNAFPIRQ